MLRCQCPSVCPSVRLSMTEVHWRLIANLGFEFRSHFTAHCSRRAVASRSSRAMLASARLSCCCWYIQGAPIKNNPLGIIHYLSYCKRFFHQIYSFYRGGFAPHTQQIPSQYLLWFKNYNHLNLSTVF